MYYDPKESGLRIQELRKKRGLTQEEVANKLNIAVSSYGNIERGFRGVSIDLAIELSQFFGVSVDYILLGRSLPIDFIKKVIREIIERLLDLEKKL